MEKKIILSPAQNGGQQKPRNQNSKNIFVNGFNLFLLAGVLVFFSLLLSSCAAIHEKAQGSIDDVIVTNKGVSYLDGTDKGDVAWNVGWLLSEGFTIGAGHPQALKTSGHKESIFGKAAVNVDDNLFPYNSYAPEKTKMSGSFYLSEGLDFINKASKESSGNFSTKVSLYYLQIPVLINYSHPVNESNSIHFGIGPYAAIGLFGHYKSSGMTRSVKFGSSSNSDDLKRLDYGLAFNAGFRFSKNWDATLNYDLGLRNVSTTPPDPDTKIRGFSLNIGYWFK
jgi:Outer membrane protein beta-barrel domain